MEEKNINKQENLQVVKRNIASSRNTKQKCALAQERELVAQKESIMPGSVMLQQGSRGLCDIILANVIVLTAVFLSVFIPIVSIALPVLMYIYLEVGLAGFVYKIECASGCKFEDIFVSIKMFIKIFCLAVVKMFLFVFWSIFLIVPGIISMLNYSFTSIILYESPELDVKGAMILSKELVKGFRWDIFFYTLLALASVCVSMSLMFFIILIFDFFLVVPAFWYIIFVVMAGILATILLAMPMVEIAVADAFILAKSKIVTKV